MLNQEIKRLLGTEWSGMKIGEQTLRLDYEWHDAKASVYLKFDQKFEFYTMKQYIDNDIVYSREYMNDYEGYFRGLYTLVSGDKYVRDFMTWLKEMPNN